MEWQKPYVGETRVIKRFALFPVTINYCVKWLEWVKIHQTYHGDHAWKNDWFVEPVNGDSDN